MTQARWRRTVAASTISACGIVALSTNAATAAAHLDAAPAIGEPVDAAMAFMVYGAMAVGLVAGLVNRAER